MKSCLRMSESLSRTGPGNQISSLDPGGFPMQALQDFQVSDQRRFEQVIGKSPALESVLEQVERVAPTDSTVLI